MWALSGWQLALTLLLGTAHLSLLSFLVTSTAILTKQPSTDMDLQITRARWVGERVVVEGGWSGDVSSVYCDLFEASSAASMSTMNILRIFLAPPSCNVR